MATEFGHSGGAERRKNLAHGVSRGISGNAVHEPRRGDREYRHHMAHYPQALSPLTGLAFCANTLPRLTPWARI